MTRVSLRVKEALNHVGVFSDEEDGFEDDRGADAVMCKLTTPNDNAVYMRLC